MFVPDQAQRLLRQLDADPGLEVFEGQAIRKLAVRLCEHAQTLPPETIGTMYPPDRIIGTPFDPSCLHGIDRYEVHANPACIQTIANARIVGSQVVVDEAGHVFAPGPIRTGQAMADLVALAGTGYLGCALARHEDGVMVWFGARRQPRRIERRALFLHNIESANYGSFIFRQLPQMFMADEQQLDVDCYVVPDRTSWLLEAIRLLGLPERPVFTIREVCGEVFQLIHMANDFDAEAFMSPSIRTGYRRLAARTARQPRRGGRIYLSRALSGVGRAGYRHLLNEVAVEAELARRGYDIVYPETLSFTGQISRLADSDRVIGPSGSGMFNMVFSPDCRVVDIESHHHTVRQHAKLYASMGRPYALMFTELDPADTASPIFRQSSLDEAHLDEALAWLEDDR